MDTRGILTKIGDWLKENSAATSFFLLLAIFVGVAVVASGCSLADIIRVKVPGPVQSAVKTTPTVSLGEVSSVWSQWEASVREEAQTRQAAYNRWVSDTESTSKLFSETIERGWNTYSVVGSLVEFGIGQATAASATIPGGAAIAVVLAGLGGLFLPKPGTEKKIGDAKDTSYDEGYRTALATLRGATAAVLAPPVMTPPPTAPV